MKVGIDFDLNMVFAVIESDQGTTHDITLHATPAQARQIADQLISCADLIDTDKSESE